MRRIGSQLPFSNGLKSAAYSPVIKFSLFVGCLTLQLAVSSPLFSAEIQNVRTGVHPDKTRVVLDVDADTPFLVTTDNKGNSLIIELPNATINHSARKTVNLGLVRGYEFLGKGKNQLLLVNTKAPVQIKRTFKIASSASVGHRIVIDLIRSDELEVSKTLPDDSPIGSALSTEHTIETSSVSTQARVASLQLVSGTPSNQPKRQMSVTEWMRTEAQHRGEHLSQPKAPVVQNIQQHTEQQRQSQAPAFDPKEFFKGREAASDDIRGMELTLDISNYAYEETTDAGAFFMSDESAPVFLSVGLRDWSQSAEDGGIGFMYTGELTYGQTDYYSASGTMTKDYYKFRTEGYAAYQVNEQFSPFVGLGYRHLLDASGGSQSSTGALGYDRLSQYLYAPIGANFDVNDKLSVKAQYNLFLQGWQTSYLSTASSAYSDIVNEQKSGWGLDITANYLIDENWSTYGFFRHWDIEKSDASTGTVSGLASFTAWEPKNTTNEIGIGIAYKF